MLRPPAKIAPRLRAAQPLVERIAPDPGAELSRDCMRGNDFRFKSPHTKTLREAAGDATDGKPFDSRADIARSRGGALKRQRVKICEVFAVYERPAHLLSLDHPDRIAFDRIAGKAMKDATAGRVDHRRMDDDAVDFRRFKNSPQLWHHPRERRQGTERRLLRRDVVAGRAKQPAAAGVDEARLFRLRRERGQARVEQATIPRAHLGVEIAGRMNDGADVRESAGPSFWHGDITGDGRRAKFAEFSRRDVRPRQGGDIVSTIEKLSHQRGADRARPAENENTHGPVPLTRLDCFWP